MEKKVLDKETADKMAFVGFIIPQFARAFKIDIGRAYRFLKEYGGIDFLLDQWWTLHVDNPIYSIRDLLNHCEMNGGKLQWQ